METSESINELAEALAKAQAEMKAAPKDSTNPHFRSRFADLATCMATATPVLSKHGLALIQATARSAESFELVTRLAHKSGQWVQARWPLPLSGKPQEMGSALTYARRYTLAIVGLVTDEDDDAEAASGRSSGPVPGGINPRPDTSRVDPRMVNDYCNRVANVKANHDLDDETKARRFYELHLELTQDDALYCAVADALASEGIVTKARWKEAIAAQRPMRKAS